MSTTFIQAVNRMLRTNGIIRGDTDVLATFSDTNHNSSSQIAQIAVQNELSELMSRGLLPYQHTINGSVTLANGTRTYSLPTDFVRFWGDPPFLYDSVQNNHIFQYPGGEDQLRNSIYTYRTQTGYPTYWYFELGTTQQVSFFLVPDASVDARVLTFDYSADNQVTIEADVLPFTSTNQDYAFIDMASRRFKYLFEGKLDQPMEADPVYREARARLFALIRGKPASAHYGKVYTGTENRIWRI